MSRQIREDETAVANRSMEPDTRHVEQPDRRTERRHGGVVIGLIVLVLLAAGPRPVAAQQSISEVLSFLMTNRSIPTDDFTRDEQAAAATGDAISEFLLTELAALPINSSAGGFTYRLDQALGSVVRSTESFGPFFTERSLTVGQGRSSFGVSYQHADFGNADGRSLRDGTLVSTASKLRSDVQPFDVETVTLRIRTDTMTLAGNYGLTDRFDLGVAVPLVKLSLSGQRVDAYRGRAAIQATGSATASGLGDIVLRAKYGVFRRGGSGFALGAESRLPTGDEDNLLGSGKATFAPRAMGSFESEKVTIHGDTSYSVGGLSNELDYDGAVTITATPRLTLIGELIGRRLSSFGTLTETTTANPRLTGVDTIRLTGAEEASHRVSAVAGIKWNLSGTWLLSANVLRPLTSAGLNASWVPTISFDYSFGQ